MSAFLYSTNPDLQNLENCLQNPLLPYQASLLKESTQNNNLESSAWFSDSPLHKTHKTEEQLYT